MKKIDFNESGKLKIVQFTDTHFENKNEDDIKTHKLMSDILDIEKPDLVVITGDFVVGHTTASILDYAAEPIIERNIPWAYVFGNHDDEKNNNKRELYEKAKGFKNSLIDNFNDSIEGLGNYYVPVQNKNNEVKWVLYFIDSNTYNKLEAVKNYGFIHRNQINWYYNSHLELTEKEGKHSALSFFHIALPEFDEVWETKVCYGEKNETSCPPKQNSGMFSAMLEAENMKGVFIGHDHVNDYHGNLYGIELCFGRATGYNTYGKEGFPRGARVIEISENDTKNFKSWLRLATGEVITEQKIMPR